MIKSGKTRKLKAYYIQRKQADPEAGSTFNPITNWFTPAEGFWDWRSTGQEEQRLIDERQREEEERQEHSPYQIYIEEELEYEQSEDDVFDEENLDTKREDFTNT